MSGGGLGFALGGPLGALLGAVAGHVLIDREGAPFGPAPRELIFTTGLVALSAKMARSDGVVTRDEVAAFQRIILIPAEQQARIESLFDLAKQTSAGFQAYASQIAEAFQDEPALLEDVLDGLFLIAAADGAIHEAEHAYLREVAAIFGMNEAGFARIEARHARRPEDPYLVLGASRDMDDASLKQLYRRLVAETHPDREIARGLPEEAVAIATRRLAAINAAWDMIERERGLSTRRQIEPA
ncbi:MAG: TerB family tellurite resistance protein [Bosea sp. (in: a-proteobacteria)]